MIRIYDKNRKPMPNVIHGIDCPNASKVGSVRRYSFPEAGPDFIIQHTMSFKSY